jgi:hypothetical protein
VRCFPILGLTPSLHVFPSHWSHLCCASTASSSPPSLDGMDLSRQRVPPHVAHCISHQIGCSAVALLQLSSRHNSGNSLTPTTLYKRYNTFTPHSLRRSYAQGSASPPTHNIVISIGISSCHRSCRTHPRCRRVVTACRVGCLESLKVSPRGAAGTRGTA